MCLGSAVSFWAGREMGGGVWDGGVHTQVNITEAAAADLAADAVLVPHSEVLQIVVSPGDQQTEGIVGRGGGTAGGGAAWRRVARGEGGGGAVPWSSCLRQTSAERICGVVACGRVDVLGVVVERVTAEDGRARPHPHRHSGGPRSVAVVSAVAVVMAVVTLTAAAEMWWPSGGRATRWAGGAAREAVTVSTRQMERGHGKAGRGQAGQAVCQASQAPACSNTTSLQTPNQRAAEGRGGRGGGSRTTTLAHYSNHVLTFRHQVNVL